MPLQPMLATGQTLLWPLYELLSEYRGTWEAKRKPLKAQVTLTEDWKKVRQIGKFKQPL